MSNPERIGLITAFVSKYRDDSLASFIESFTGQTFDSATAEAFGLERT